MKAHRMRLTRSVSWRMARHRRVFRPRPIRIEYGPALELLELPADEIVAVVDRTLREMLQASRDRR